MDSSMLIPPFVIVMVMIISIILVVISYHMMAFAIFSHSSNEPRNIIRRFAFHGAMEYGSAILCNVAVYLLCDPSQYLAMTITALLTSLLGCVYVYREYLSGIKNTWIKYLPITLCFVYGISLFIHKLT